MGALEVQSSHELKGNSLKFGQDTDSRVQVFCFHILGYAEQAITNFCCLLVGFSLFVCFKVILPF